MKKTNDKAQSIQFSLVNESKFSEFFQNRENLINYLLQEYKSKKEQVNKIKIRYSNMSIYRNVFKRLLRFRVSSMKPVKIF